MQQDNDTTHQQVHLWMAQKNKIKVLEWPNQSPDLNPIEILRHDLTVLSCLKTLQCGELKQFCKDEWTKSPTQPPPAMWKTHCQLYKLEHVSEAERCDAQLNIPLMFLTLTGKPNPAQITLSH